MKSIRVTEYGGPEILRLTEQADLRPDADEVTIDVKYIGVGLIDSLLRQGAIKVGLPFVPGLEVSGIVREVGANVTVLRPGLPVVALLLTNFGGYATLVKAPKSIVAPLPSADLLEEAAATAVDFTAAFLFFNDIVSVSASTRILVHGASGGLGRACCKIAKAMGVEYLVGSTSSDAKKALLTTLGCTKAVLSRDMRSQLPELDGGGFDAIVDPVGGNVRRESVGLLAQRGKLLLVGSADQSEDVQLSSNELWLANHEAVGVNVGAMAMSDPHRVMSAATRVMAMIAEGRVDPGPIEVLPFDQAAAAHRLLDERKARGKIVLKV
jgi:NADPH2:quinone reductase